MPAPSPTGPIARDRALRRFRVLAFGVGTAAAAGTVGLSVVAAHAFKGHGSHASAIATRPRRVHVPPAQRVPAISARPAPLTPPAEPPAAAPAVPAAPPPASPPPVSGGS